MSLLLALAGGVAAVDATLAVTEAGDSIAAVASISSTDTPSQGGSQVGHWHFQPGHSPEHMRRRRRRREELVLISGHFLP